MRQVVYDDLSDTYVMAGLFAAFGLIALLIAAAGIYGMMSYSVSQRTREIAVRLALGAQVRDVLKMVMSQGGTLLLVAFAVGLSGGFALARIMTSLLYGVAPTDPATWFGVSLILAAVALLACYVPSRRATKVDPVVALRYE